MANTTRIESAIKNRELLEERRELIISTATKLFMDRGYDDVSVNEVADAMGVSIGSLYKYVRSKEDILWLVMDSIYGQLENLLKAERAVAAGPRDALLHAFERYLRAVDSVRRGILLMYREYRNLPSDAQAEFMERERRIVQIFEEIVTEGVEAGEFGSTDTKMVALDLDSLGPHLGSQGMDAAKPVPG